MSDFQQDEVFTQQNDTHVDVRQVICDTCEFISTKKKNREYRIELRLIREKPGSGNERNGLIRDKPMALGTNDGKEIRQKRFLR